MSGSFAALTTVWTVNHVCLMWKVNSKDGAPGACVPFCLCNSWLSCFIWLRPLMCAVVGCSWNNKDQRHGKVQIKQRFVSLVLCIAYYGKSERQLCFPVRSVSGPDVDPLLCPICCCFQGRPRNRFKVFPQWLRWRRHLWPPLHTTICLVGLYLAGNHFSSATAPLGALC